MLQLNNNSQMYMYCRERQSIKYEVKDKKNYSLNIVKIAPPPPILFRESCIVMKQMIFWPIKLCI